MSGRLRLQRSSWTLADQGIVSAGNFALNVVLARRMPPIDYGIFVLLYGLLLTLAAFNATLLFYPLSVRLAQVSAAAQARLLYATLLLVVTLSSALGMLMSAALAVLGYADLILPALACFLAWQIQETLRRGLLTRFRHRAAIPGDAVSYLGQALAAVGLASMHALTLVSLLYAMAATSVLATVIQACQIDLATRGPLGLRETTAEYWRIGGAWSLGNGMLAQARLLVLPWVLAAAAGPVVVAGFQAASNIVNLSNPLIIGLCNLIPQTAAQASLQGRDHAWQATRGYVALALIGLALYSAVVLIVPGLLLRIVYGGHSGYDTLNGVLRLLIIGGFLSSIAEILISYLHGINAARLAFWANAIGTASVPLLAWSLIAALGVVGAYLALVASNAIRFAAAWAIVARTARSQDIIDSTKPRALAIAGGK